MSIQQTIEAEQLAVVFGDCWIPPNTPQLTTLNRHNAINQYQFQWIMAQDALSNISDLLTESGGTWSYWADSTGRVHVYLRTSNTEFSEALIQAARYIGR